MSQYEQLAPNGGKKWFNPYVKFNETIETHIFTLVEETTTTLSNEYNDDSVRIPLNSIDQQLRFKLMYLFANILKLNFENIANPLPLVIERRSAIDPNTSQKYINLIINQNYTLAFLAGKRWQDTISRINIDRYNKLNRSKHFPKYFKNICLFIEHMMNLPFNIAKNVVIYSGSALVLYGITYTKDIDIIVFNMTFNEIDQTILKDISKEIETSLDIAVYVPVLNQFVKYTKCRKPNVNEINAELHHNDCVLGELIKMTSSDIENRTPDDELKYGPLLLSGGRSRRDNNRLKETSVLKIAENKILSNSILIGGVHVFSIKLLEQFYTYRYNMIQSKYTRYVLIDMLYMHMFVGSPRFEINTRPDDKMIDKVKSLYKEYENTELPYTYNTFVDKLFEISSRVSPRSHHSMTTTSLHSSNHQNTTQHVSDIVHFPSSISLGSSPDNCISQQQSTKRYSEVIAIGKIQISQSYIASPLPKFNRLLPDDSQYNRQTYIFNRDCQYF